MADSPRIHIKLPEIMISNLDRISALTHRTRSEIIRTLLTRAMNDDKFITMAFPELHAKKEFTSKAVHHQESRKAVELPSYIKQATRELDDEDEEYDTGETSPWVQIKGTTTYVHSDTGEIVSEEEKFRRDIEEMQRG